jgi:peptidoglycan/xylan/chitin deacetylase (PgdA/CDA1 family)
MSNAHAIHNQRIQRKKNPKSKQNRFIEMYIPFVILLCTFSVFLAFIIALVQSQFRQVIETQKTEIHKVPVSVSKNFPLKPSVSIRVPILLYHYVEYVKDKGDTIRQSLNIMPHTFEAQIKTLVDAGYTFLTASEFANILDGTMDMPSKPILITFDDGHWDVYTDILPILEKYHVKATVYVISGLIDGADFMTKDQLAAVIQSGLIEIGAHTVHHVALAGKLAPVVQYEVAQSKKQLEDTYHISVVSFAYPGGSFDQHAIDVVRATGYRTAVSTVPGIEQSQTNRLFLYRLRPGYRTGQALINYLEIEKNYRPW